MPSGVDGSRGSAPEYGEWSVRSSGEGKATGRDDVERPGTPVTDGGSDQSSAERPSDDEVVEAAAAAAGDLVFARLDRGDVEDYDVTVTFEDDVLEVDVYVQAPDADADADRVADDAALAASGAVDDLFDDAER